MAAANQVVYGKRACACHSLRRGIKEVTNLDQKIVCVGLAELASPYTSITTIHLPKEVKEGVRVAYRD